MRVVVSPFIKQALLTDTRSVKTYLVRGALVLFLTFCVISAHQTAAFLGAPGRMLLSQIAGMTAFLICLGGPLYFASVITDEKEKLTLGLLKMTGLRPLSIVSGKFSHQLLGAVLLLVVQVPLVMLAITLGGVSGLQVVSAFLALLAHLVFISSLGLLFSTLCRRSRGAAVLTGVALLAFFLGAPLMVSLVKEFVAAGVLQKGGPAASVIGGPAELAVRASVFEALGKVLATGFTGPVVGFQFLSNVALGGLFILLACVSFERFSRDSGAAAPGRGLAFRTRARLRRLGIGRPWRNAVLWKDFYFLIGGKWTVLLAFLLSGALLAAIGWVLKVSQVGFGREDFGAFAMIFMLVLTCIGLVLCVSRVFAGELKWHTLASIWILPVSAIGIVWRKLVACFLAVIPLLLWFGLGAVLCPEEFFEGVRVVLKEPPAWYFVASYLLLLQLTMYFSLVLRRTGLLVAFVVWFFSVFIAGQTVGLLLTFVLTLGMASMNVGFAVLTAVVLGATVGLHVVTLGRLRKVAARE